MLVSMISCSSAKSVSTNAPPCPTPALSAAAASGRPVAVDRGRTRPGSRRGCAGPPAPPARSRPRAAQLLRGRGEAGVLRVDDQVEAVVGELARELESDAAGGTGDERE